MKIAVAKSGENISEHFGHCEGFEIFDIEDKTISPSGFMASPTHERGSLPKFLKEQNVDVLIAGGLGKGAVAKLSDSGIDIISGISGSPFEAVKTYVDGKLETIGVPCSGHGDHDGDHHHEHHHDHHKDGNRKCRGQGHKH